MCGTQNSAVDDALDYCCTKLTFVKWRPAARKMVLLIKQLLTVFTKALLVIWYNWAGIVAGKVTKADMALFAVANLETFERDVGQGDDTNLTS